LIARCLKQHGVEFCFGIVGVPVFGIAAAMQKEGIKYVGTRHEQTAAYAAGAIGYLTGRPGACLTVSGPGMTNAISGLGNAQVNCWPMILIGGASETYRNGMGSFQEERQVLAATPVSKWAHAIEHVNRIPFYVEMAVRQSTYGRPGATYLDFPDDMITGSCDTADVDTVRKCPPPPRTMAAVLAALASRHEPAATLTVIAAARPMPHSILAPITAACWWRGRPPTAFAWSMPFRASSGSAKASARPAASPPRARRRPVAPRTRRR